MFDGKLGEDKWLSNLLIARERWVRVPVDEVIPGLCQWRCGTLACFGGHLCTWPEFIAQGIYVNAFGAPQHDAHEPEIVLFGDYAMGLFSTSRHCETSAQAHAEVLRRLDTAIAERRAVLAKVAA